MSYQKYRIYCVTEGVFHTVWSLNPPTECPVDAGHDINPDSITDVATNETTIRIASVATNTDTEYTTVFQTINRADRPFEFIKCIYSLEDGTGSVRLYDVTDPNTLSESIPLTATTGPTIYNLPAFVENPPSDEIVEFQIKKSGGTGDLFVETILLYTS